MPGTASRAGAAGRVEHGARRALAHDCLDYRLLDVDERVARLVIALGLHVVPFRSRNRADNLPVPELAGARMNDL